jgi:hypothetical protein
MGVEITTSGPIFDGRAVAALHEYKDDMLDRVGAQGLADVQFMLDRSIRHPTPYYETQITVERAGNERIVHDRGIIYGPWLEGVGSRNRTTRFKGYFSFRRARQALDRKAGPIAEATLQRYLPRMQ